jgi:hypothetical protein
VGVALKYALCVLTHGEGETLDQTTSTFYEMVTPNPVRETIFRDDGTRGFCRAVGEMWEEASSYPDVDYIFWLEHDFRFVRPVDLDLMAAVLDENPGLAQMALIRDPVDVVERKAGGWLGLHADSLMSWVCKGHMWHQHTICFTTNPSLIPRKFMERNPWPEYPGNCEKLFSADLREAGYSFGSWGAEAQVEHTGQLRTGHGY